MTRCRLSWLRISARSAGGRTSNDRRMLTRPGRSVQRARRVLKPQDPRPRRYQSVLRRGEANPLCEPRRSQVSQGWLGRLTAWHAERRRYYRQLATRALRPPLSSFRLPAVHDPAGSWRPKRPRGFPESGRVELLGVSGIPNSPSARQPSDPIEPFGRLSAFSSPPLALECPAAPDRSHGALLSSKGAA